MTNPNKTLIAFLIDRSGSMEAIKADTEGGYAAFLQSQLDELEEHEEVLVTLAQFDTEYEVVFKNADLKTLPKYKLQPRGGTALVDSLFRLVQEVGEDLAGRPEEDRPGKVIVVTLTDGEENSSREVTADKLKEKIEEQKEKYSWEFLFLGANIDAVEVGARYGFAANASMTYGANSAGVGATFAAASRVTGALKRGAALRDVAYTEAERSAALGVEDAPAPSLAVAGKPARSRAPRSRKN